MPPSLRVFSCRVSRVGSRARAQGLRLLSFPIDWPLVGQVATIRETDPPKLGKHALAGNAVAPLMAACILHHIKRNLLLQS